MLMIDDTPFIIFWSAGRCPLVPESFRPQGRRARWEILPVSLFYYNLPAGKSKGEFQKKRKFLLIFLQSLAERRKFWYNYKKDSPAPDFSGAEGTQNGANYPKPEKTGAIKVRDIYPQSDTARLTQGLREHLQEMTAASQALGSGLAGNEKAAQYLAVLNRAICAQLRLVRRIELDGRLNSPDEIRLERTLVDLVELGRGTAERADALTRPFLDIKTEFSSALPALPTLADGGALEDMLLGFVSNSVRAIGRAGSIRLELEQAEDRAVFTVTDTGGGLDPEVLAGLFDPQEEPESPARGLILARRIAELHGGTLVAGTAEPSGARLAVSIPIVEQTGGGLRSPRLRVDSGGGWDPALVALSECLPAQAFLPDRGSK